MGYGVHESDSQKKLQLIQELRYDSEGLVSFGDIRVAERAEWLINRVAATGSLVLRKVGETRAGEMAAHRFLSSPYVTVDRIIETLAQRTAKQCAGRRVLAVQDTSEVNFAGSEGKRRGFGPAGDGKTPGFFIHPVIAVDIESEAVVGVVDAAIWTRPAAPTTARRARPTKEKESARWLAANEVAAARLSEACSVTMVADRESDIYELFVHRPTNLDLIVRAAQDRSLATGGRLFEALSGTKALGSREVIVAPRGPGDKGRTATVELRSATVCIARPKNGLVADLPVSIELNLVEAREINPPPGKTALLWRLLTTHSVGDVAQADEVVQLARDRVDGPGDLLARAATEE